MSHVTYTKSIIHKRDNVTDSSYTHMPSPHFLSAASSSASLTIDFRESAAADLPTTLDSLFYQVYTRTSSQRGSDSDGASDSVQNLHKILNTTTACDSSIMWISWSSYITRLCRPRSQDRRLPGTQHEISVVCW